MNATGPRPLRPVILAVLAALPALGNGVVINEIMFHPVSENELEEYVELHNTDPVPINLAGWRFTRGVDFTFPGAIIPANGYLVVAADLATFQAKYPGVTNVVGGWVGRLSNIDEDIELQDAASNVVDLVYYADDGDFAIRQRGPLDRGTRGWEWYNEADGSSVNTSTGQTVGGKSLELINPLLPRDNGQNWTASSPVEGTPGRANSVANTNVAPLIYAVSYYPPIPKPTDVVTITAGLIDERSNGVTARVFFRNASTLNPPAFASTNLFDDGLHNDGLAGDGLFGAFLPPRANGTVVEFYVEARDAQDNVRTWPAPARLETGVFAQAANALYQVDDNLAPPGPSAGDQPMYRLILTETERVEFANINRSSDAQMNATFISSDADGIQVRHNVGVRVRGAGSRSRTPHNLRLNLPTDRRWNGLNELNFNCQFIHLQVAGSALAAKSGMPAAQARIIQVRLNGANPAPSQPPVNGTSQGAGFGGFIYVEVFNSDWANRLMPTNSGGNFYRASRFPWTANLKFLNTTNPTAWVNEGYSKTSNQSENDWSDLDELTRALSSGLPENEYLEAVRTNANVVAFMRYFTLCNLLDYRESALCGGVGDDYAMYRGTVDRRFMLIPHDFDTILGQGDSAGSTTRSIWTMIDSPRSTATNQQALFLIRFLRHPEFAPVYFQEFKRMIEGAFAPEQFDPMVDNLLGGWVPEDMMTALKTWMTARRASVWSQLPLSYAVNVGLPTSNGYPTTTSPEATINGRANAIETKTVMVNGTPAEFTVWQGRWTNTVALAPGLNNVLVQFLDADGKEVSRSETTVWYDDGSVQPVAGAIATDTTWTALAGPYHVTGDLTIGAGATLTIERGTTVYLDSGADIIVANGGRILAEGTDTARIRFTRAPGGAATWGGLTINGGPGSPETRIAYAHLEFNGSTAIHSAGGTVFLDHLTFGNSSEPYLALDDSSFVVSDCVFPTATDEFEMVHGTGGIKSGGRGLFRRNFFGAALGYSDVVDFTGGNRPGQPILEFINNVFMGSGDDLLDVDGTDAWVEGNIFMHAHKNGSPDTASALSSGPDGGLTSEITMMGNIIYDCDHAAMAKGGNFTTLINNTIVRQTRQGGTDTDAAVACLADEGFAQGAGMYLEGNILYDVESLVRFYTNSAVTFTNNLMPLAWAGPGGGNSIADPFFQHVPQLAETTGFTTWRGAQVMREWFSLRSGSPAIATGPNGQDKGGGIPLGASIAGEPEGTTPLNTATLTVGVNRTGNGIPTAGWPDGSGFTHYQWRLDGAGWSAETPVATPITLTGLISGDHYVEMKGRRDSGTYQDDPVYGVDAVITRSRTWTVTSAASTIRINEVLASNSGSYPHFGTTPDCIELHNAGTAAADLTGMRLTDDAGNPGRFVFPAGASIAAGGYLVVLANNPDGTPGYHVGFNLAQEGQGLYLFDSVARGGAMLDAVTFGPQLTDRSIGRLGGEWTLCQPTLGSANWATPVGDPHLLRINEWLADGTPLARQDFLELYNPQPWPVNMGGLYLTDNPIGEPARHRITPLSFMGPNDFFAFTADANTNVGPEHVNFRLGNDQGLIGLFDEQLALIDCVYYGPQVPGIAEGRQPNGGTNLVSLVPPTPGAGNAVVLGGCTVTTTTEPLMAYDQAWRYNQTQDLTGTPWISTGFNDSAWPSGAGLLAFENNAAINPLINTDLADPRTAAPGLSAPRVYYFRTRFNLTASLAGAEVIARLRIDDGAVIYLNGTELARIRMPSGTITYTNFTTSNPGDATADEVLAIPVNRLVQGNNVLAAQVHQSDAGSSDIVWGMAIDLIRRQTNCIQIPVVLNEIMANNNSTANADGTVTDWVELFNPSASATNLSGMSLTDDPSNPRRWVVPQGVVLPAGGYLVVRCDSSAPPSTNNTPPFNTGFGLGANGDQIHLFDASGTVLDGLVFGLQASDFTVGRVPNGTGEWTLNLPTPGSLNIGAAAGEPAFVRINEWMADPAGGDDWFEIFNPNPQPVDLGGHYLTDNLADRTQYQITPLSYLSSGGKGFAVFFADNNPQNGVDHVNFRLSGDGESIGLFSPSQTQVDVVTFGPQLESVSEGRLADGATNIVRFPLTPTQGNANYLPLTQVVVNEALTHSDLPLEDAIELRNLSPEAIDISGWWLSDAQDDPRRFRIPPDTLLLPSGHVVFYEYQFNPPEAAVPTFALSSLGDEIYLSEADALGNLTGYRSVVDFGPAENAVSFGRYETSVGADFVAMSALSLGTSIGSGDPTNLVTVFRTGQGATNPYPKVGPIVISEIMYHPPDIGTNDNTQDEFIELLNITTASVTLFDPAHPTNTWHLRDGVDFDFPPDVTLPAGGFLLVVGFNPTNTAELAAFRAKYGVGAGVPIYGPYGGQLANGGEGINLRKPDVPGPDGDAPYVLVERIVYGDDPPWPTWADGNTNSAEPTGVSLQRIVATDYGNDPVNWMAAIPTPGQGSFAPIFARPSIITQPQGQSIPPGGTATFSVVADGFSPLVYQWRFNGMDIAGATNESLTLANVTVSDAGRYAVRVSNPTGAILSDSAELVVQVPPEITRQPQNRIAAAGGATTFNVIARGGQPLAYQWRKDGVPLAGATSLVLNLTNLVFADQGAYSVVVSNAYGVASSSDATLQVFTPPTLLVQPQPADVFVGGTASFTVVADGTAPFFYQWRFGNTPLVGRTNATLMLNNVQLAQAGSYSVLVSNLVGIVLSDPATLTVRVPPIISVTAPDPTATETGPTTGQFTVSRGGDLDLAVTVNLTVAGSAVPGSDYVAISGPISFASGQTAALVTVTPIDDVELEGNETIVLSIVSGTGYVVGSPSSATVTLFDDDNQAPVVAVTNPVENALFTAPVNVPLGATASDPDGSVVKVEFFDYSTNRIGQVVSAPYGLTWTNAPVGPHRVTAVATDNFGSTGVSLPVNFLVNAAPAVAITSPPNGAIFPATSNIAVAANASDLDGLVTQVDFYEGTELLGSDDSAPYSILWTNVPAGNFTLTARATDDRGAVTVSPAVAIVVRVPAAGFGDMFTNRGAMFGFTNTVQGNNTGYTVEAGEPQHDGRAGTHSAWLTWTAPVTAPVTMDTFDSGFDTVLAVYTNSPPSIQTVSNLVKVASNDDDDSTTLQSRVRFTAVAGVTYQIAVDGYNDRSFGAIVFHLFQANPYPGIVTPPQSQIADAGTTVTFSVVAGGPGPLNYRWLFNGTEIPGAISTNLVLDNVQPINSGTYAAVVVNNSGSVTSAPATLIVFAPPTIITQPQTVVVDVGDTAVFTVDALGTGPILFQWRKNGTDIPGAVDSFLIIDNVQYTNGGVYSVTVANASGSVPSADAELIVRPRIIGGQVSTNLTVIVEFLGTPGKGYELQGSSDLKNWTPVSATTNVTVLGSTGDSNPALDSRFYRLRVLP